MRDPGPYGYFHRPDYHTRARTSEEVPSDAYETNPAAATSENCDMIADAQCEPRYRFEPHFHPYLEALINRLTVGSTGKLLAADTEYPPDPLQQLQQLPGSTRVRMEDGKILWLEDGTDIDIIVGDPPEPTEHIRIPNARLLELGIGTEITITDDLADLNTEGQPYGRYAKATLIGVEPIRALYDGDFFAEEYQPSKNLVDEPHPVKEIDFASDGAYSVYNWELFYHVPLTVAIHLSKNQRFEEAQRWFHYIFDPTDDSEGPTPERFWKVKPFQYREVNLIEQILENLHTGADPELLDKTTNCIEEWTERPFRPHLVARFRQTPYMFKAVMAYLDNLIAWGDSLFRQDTRESINEAMQIYVLAAKILGNRPQLVPKKGSIRPQTYHNLKTDRVRFGNAMREIESEYGNDMAPAARSNIDRGAYLALRSIGQALYFCVPRNDKLIGYWDTVADRLFKMRNSLNLQGIFRQLPLFQPPIDPALLAKAAAAGLDVGAVVSGINQPLPLVRFRLLVQKASEICQDVKSLGNGLLAAIEKEDNEALAVLRASHEQIILERAKTLKYGQWQEAIKTREGLEKSLAATVQRLAHYAKLLGRSEEDIGSLLNLPTDMTIDTVGLDELDDKNLAGENYEQGEGDLAEIEGEPVIYDIAEDVKLITGEQLAGGSVVSSKELEELAKLKEALDWEISGHFLDTLATGLSLIPQFSLDVDPMGIGASAEFGGVQLSKMLSMMGSAARAASAKKSYEATRAGKIGSYKRREQEWAHQINLAAGEINQTVKQLRAAQIHEFVACKDYENQEKQIELAGEIQQFLEGEEASLGDKKYRKTTTQAFYAWLRREVKGLYADYFQFAFDVAKKAQRALQDELGDPSASFLNSGYLAGKEGLFAGEKLYLDIKRMEMAYHELNRREYELTKHVSLQQVDPVALMELRATGRCTVDLPEMLFDMDCPGHYFRRIKTVAVSIPCVTGPYTSVNCTLTLLKSSIRKTPQLHGGEGENPYARSVEDNRFSDYFGSLQSIVTSSGQNDSGLFETSLHDERVLPFEGSGVISTWQLQLPANPAADDRCQFDYDTISDIIIHFRYTAREGGDPLRDSALTNAKTLINQARAVGSVRVLSVRHDFPNEWAGLKAAPAPSEQLPYNLVLPLRQEHFPLWFQKDSDRISKLEVFSKPSPVSVNDIDLIEAWGDMYRGEVDIDTPSRLPVSLQDIDDAGGLSLQLSDNGMEELWIAVTWDNSA